MKRYVMGDSCMVWSLGIKIDRKISRHVLKAYRKSKNILCHEPGFRDVVPSYTDLALYFDPMESDIEHMIHIVETVIRECKRDENAEGKTVRFGVVYSGEDLNRVSRLNKLTERQVIQRHTAAIYTVAMIGFQPHFPYLIGLDPALETPRLDNPRTRVPAGAVAIGGAQAGVYPSTSPGGWNIIGMTRVEPLKRLEPGDRVIFEEVSSL